jgi:hypothetical protein
MVRAITGTLVQVGRGFWPESQVEAVLKAMDRRLAGPTAPPEGLFLMRVTYPGEAAKGARPPTECGGLGGHAPLANPTATRHTSQFADEDSVGDAGDCGRITVFSHRDDRAAIRVAGGAGYQSNGGKVRPSPYGIAAWNPPSNPTDSGSMPGWRRSILA